MRGVGEFGVLKSAVSAAALAALACLPRLVLWPTRRYPLWYLDALVFLGGAVLWAFVFAWHTEYTGLPIITANVQRKHFHVATVSGVLLAILLRLFLDPTARSIIPDDYPATLGQWLAMTLFNLGFTQLFLVFAPFAWMFRLSGRKEFAITFTVIFGVVVLLIRNHSAHAPLPLGLAAGVGFCRGGGGGFCLFFFLCGGDFLGFCGGLLLRMRRGLGWGGGGGLSRV